MRGGYEGAHLWLLEEQRGNEACSVFCGPPALPMCVWKQRCWLVGISGSLVRECSDRTVDRQCVCVCVLGFTRQTLGKLYDHRRY